MKPYQIIKGDTENLEDFEQKISGLVEQGYEFEGDLITNVVVTGSSSKIVLLQAMILEEAIDLEDMEDFEYEN